MRHCQHCGFRLVSEEDDPKTGPGGLPQKHFEWLKKVAGYRDLKEFVPPLDPGIKKYVEILYAAGIDTTESCQGGPGHSFSDPTIVFGGTYADGYKALSIARTYGFPVRKLHRTWSMDDNELVGPEWTLVLWLPPIR